MTAGANKMTRRPAWLPPTEYVQRRIAFRAQQAAHRAEAGPDCRCLTCETAEGIAARVAALRAEQEQRNGEPPF